MSLARLKLEMQEHGFFSNDEDKVIRCPHCKKKIKIRIEKQ